MERNKQGKGEQEREREKETEQRDIPRPELEDYDEKKQKYNSKQKSIEAKGGSPDFSSHSRRKTKNERGAPLLGQTRMDLYACIQWPGIVNQAELNQCQSSINI